MPPFIAFILAAFFVGIGVGGFGVHQIDKAEIQSYEFSLQMQKTEAQALLSGAQSRIAESEKQAVFANHQLDKSHEAYIKTANAYDLNLDTYRMYTGGGQNCHGEAANSDNAGIPANAADRSEYAEQLNGVVREFSARLDRLINEKAKLSAAAYIYAKDAHQFAFVDNCGIARPEQ